MVESYLICSVLEIDKNKSPDWAAAERVLNNMTEEQCFKAIVQAYGYDINDEDDCNVVKTYLSSLTAKERVRQAFNNTVKGWSMRHNGMLKIALAYSTILMAADMSDGGVAEPMEDLEIISYAGLHRAAGFIS